jgi:hypothetical protein
VRHRKTVANMSKRTSVPLPTVKPGTKSKPEPQPKKKALSKETIVDSSDESAIQDKRKSPVKIGVHMPNGTARKPSQSKPKVNAEPEKPVHVNEELESESSDSDASDKSTRSNEYPKDKAGGDGSDSSDESDEEQAPTQNTLIPYAFPLNHSRCVLTTRAGLHSQNPHNRNLTLSHSSKRSHSFLQKASPPHPHRLMLRHKLTSYSETWKASRYGISQHLLLSHYQP